MDGMIRPFALATVLGIVACGSGGGEDGGGSGGVSSGGTAGTSSGGTGGQSASGGSDSGGRNGGGSGGRSGSSGSGGSMGSCVTETRVLHDLVMGDAGPPDLSICDFTVPADVDDNYINVFIGRAVGAGTKVCWRASSQGCNPDGFWLNGGQILLCDHTCSTYFDPEPDLVVYIEIGCKIDSCL
jgi:hypothetical protein